MAKHCCWGTCRSDSRYPKPGVSFVPFPKPYMFPEKARKWVILCGRGQEWRRTSQWTASPKTPTFAASTFPRGATSITGKLKCVTLHVLSMPNDICQVIDGPTIRFSIDLQFSYKDNPTLKHSERSL